MYVKLRGRKAKAQQTNQYVTSGQRPPSTITLAAHARRRGLTRSLARISLSVASR